MLKALNVIAEKLRIPSSQFNIALEKLNTAKKVHIAYIKNINFA